MQQLAMFGSEGPIERKFWEFHARNPDVYYYLRRFAREWRSRHGDDAILGIKMLIERVRWELGLGDEDPIKLNNNYAPFYARLLMEREPDLAGAFRLRRQAMQASIGPDSDDLPFVEHVV